MATLTNLTKNTATAIAQQKGGFVLWDDVLFSWDSAFGLWDSPLNIITNIAKNTGTMTNVTKN